MDSVGGSVNCIAFKSKLIQEILDRKETNATYNIGMFIIYA